MDKVNTDNRIEWGMSSGHIAEVSRECVVKWKGKVLILLKKKLEFIKISIIAP